MILFDRFFRLCPEAGQSGQTESEQFESMIRSAKKLQTGEMRKILTVEKRDSEREG